MLADKIDEIRLDRKIRLWIYSVSFLSAFVNMSGFLNFSYSLSHFTGNYTEIFNDIYEHSFSSAFVLIGLTAFYVLGSVIASFINADKDFRLQNKYGEIQLVIGVCLLIITLFINQKYVIVFFLSCALGTQNGLIRSYRGLGFKTTHVTGTLTDLGVYIGYAIRGEKNVGWKIMFELSLLLAFGSGTLTSILIYPVINDRIFILAAIAYILAGMNYFRLRKRYMECTDN